MLRTQTSTPFDPEEYKQQIRVQILQRETIIFSSVFSPDGQYLVCGNNFGRIAIWKLAPYLTEQYWENKPSHSRTEHHPTPCFSFQACPPSQYSSIYTLIFCGSDVLISGGDNGIDLWNWKKIVSLIEERTAMEQEVRSSKDYSRVQSSKDSADMMETDQPTPSSSQSNSLAPASSLLLSRLSLPSSFSSTSSSSSDSSHPESPFEINGLATSRKDSRFLYAATGDTAGYVWDLNTSQSVGQLKGHADYLHCILTTRREQILTGSEDGTVRVWDARTLATESVIEPNARATHSGSANITKFQQHRDSVSSSLGAEGNGWISCMALDDSENWLVCGGGGRVLTMWHLPSLEPMTMMPMRAAPQTVLFYEDKILAAGNEDKIYHWHKTNGKLETTVQATSGSIFSLQMNAEPVTNRILVATGTTPLVDVFANLCNRSFSFLFQY